MIGASIGAALVPDGAADIDSLLKCADLALCRAKQSDKGTFRWFEAGMDMRQRERRALEIELRGAEIEREFELHCQPIIRTQTGKLRGFEALLRWQNPRRGMVSPADFIPIAEETGKLDELGRWVFAMACREAATWPRDLVLSVNVSPVQFRKGNLVGGGLALAGSGLEAHQLEIEITESVLLAESSTNLAILKQLRSLGVRIALDDFGTGYSSLSYLRQVPFNRLKIDRSFVREIGRCPESLAIVRAVIGLGTNLGIDTTAEGRRRSCNWRHCAPKNAASCKGSCSARRLPARVSPPSSARISKRHRVSRNGIADLCCRQPASRASGDWIEPFCAN
ncbi:GGDEF domain-containing phosphodiesterase [Mesorhizobium sp. VK25A]|uniref:GGDEF domain-containing phosphodiesterase n=2 Tax=Mesorhizobium TaxID=68287 RepID=A0ABU5ADG9_9HYPH|nr:MULTISPECIES: GGDEF domain-containing phosphodiesterase [unclassified Mesorhizobium]MDX8469773.1 GGDEF domain-containing phosphodiesterase [Mesorhizobium sp. VK23B]MDX8476112.1 GGDEF domain-containing phosphodiesterase [Mesorhizobium sp. VK23A]MDX8508365.1 GGDEF domain-containing phosphodiesterase [Mesorhizobium sp. VK22E]MDX8535316.1 GGDEF domain-containing phosphodiesterase [Mesorhizobium sp. VK25D]MDX8546816.1 GGDEF domain-containing phosphodiesterase [Mesorhizobium sp. VK25A]